MDQNTATFIFRVTLKRRIDAFHWANRLGPWVLVAIFIGCASYGQSVQADKIPSITITSAPLNAPGEAIASDPITGTVTGIKSDEASQYKVVVYAYGGDRWYIQPLQDASDIAVDADGRWETETHGGLQFVALLVKSSFKPRTTLETIYQAGGEIIAVARKKSGSK